jgi:NitT/TauT family transport system substrate-binding protein
MNKSTNQNEMVFKTNINSFCVTFFSFLVLVIFWEILSRLSNDLVFVLPPPSSIALQLFEKRDRLLFHTLETLKVMAGGFSLAVVAAFPLGWMMMSRKTMRHLLQPLFIMSQCIPMFALAPLMVIWFGWSYTAVVIPTALMIFFPLTMSVYRGLSSTPRAFLDYFRLNQATKLQTFYKLQLPWALPSIFSGLRVSAGFAGVGAVAGEWAGAQNGLGMLMLESRRGADLEMVFCALACLTMLTLVIYAGIVFIERYVAAFKFMRVPKLTGLAVIAALLISCQSDSSTHKTQLMLDWLPNSNHVPIYAGMEKGFFTQQGITIAIRKIADPSDPLLYLNAGQTDLAISYTPSVIISNSHQNTILIIGVLISEPLNAVIFRKSEEIITPEDLNNKVMGYCVDSTGQSSLDYLLKTNQIRPKELKNVAFDVVTALGSKRVDAIYGAFWNIECEQLKAKGVETEFFKLSDLGVPNYAELVICARKGSEQAASPIIEKFQVALQASIDFCRSNPDEAFEIYAKANPDKAQQTLAWEKEAWYKTLPLFSSTQMIDEQGMQKFEEWLKRTKNFPLPGNPCP